MKTNCVSSLYLKVLTGFAALALGSLSGSDGKSMAGDHNLPVKAQSVQFDRWLTTGGTKKTGNTELRKSTEVVEKHLSGSGRLLTIRQKRLFVLGIGASENK
jgi:hypothetical protein